MAALSSLLSVWASSRRCFGLLDARSRETMAIIRFWINFIGSRIVLQYTGQSGFVFGQIRGNDGNLSNVGYFLFGESVLIINTLRALTKNIEKNI